MDYKKASQIKLRFHTPVGVLSVEDLWDLNLETLDKMAINLKKQVESSEESFIKRTRKDPKLTISFEIVKDVISTKLEEAEKRKAAAEKRTQRAQILEAMAKKQQESIGSKSLEELEKELAALDDE